MRLLGALGVSAALVIGVGAVSSASADAPTKSARTKRKSAPAKKASKKRAKKKRKVKVPQKRRGKKGKTRKRPPKSVSPMVRKALDDKKHRRAPKFAACSAEVPQPPPGQVGAVLNSAYAWPAGSTLRIGFVDGSYEARTAVRDMANRWTEHANLKFDWVLTGTGTEDDLDIRIQFDAPSCSSKLGTSSRYAAEWGEVTMRLCNKDEQIGSDRFQRVVLHEFGHALGLEHEHQNPNAKFEWNYDYVYNYYATYSGWDRARTDRNVFDAVNPSTVLASEHDPDSVMHYSFPPEFTVDGTSLGGKNEISALDAEKIAEWYPAKSNEKVRTFVRRKVAVWNRTAEPITVKVVYETKAKKKGVWLWAPSSSVSKGKAMTLGPGMKELLPKAYGRRAKLVATNDFGDRWTLDEPLAKEYQARKMETYVLEVEGAPDTPPSKSPDELYDSGTKALEDGKYKVARKRFNAFAKRYPSDSRVSWARFNVMLSWYQAGHYNRSIQAGYDLITDMPDAVASDFAWFYGGAASFELGQCENAKAYFEFVADPDFGLPKDWRDGAQVYLETIEEKPGKYCR
ncbi:MAG: outer membrane protein assembly factor BamD [Nannocystaceae bacterium]|nr:outer membrane protein assembly factor BamD [bacterium]